MNLSDLGKMKEMMTQAREMQAQMDQKLAQTIVEAETGGGMVKVRMNGKKEVLRLTIEPTALGATTGDIELLEDLIAAAVNQAGRLADEAMKSSVAGLMGGLNLPGTGVAVARFAEPMSRLIDELRKLPGVGAKSAQRLAFHVLRSPDSDARALAAAILELRAQLRLCSICNNVTDVDPCVYCTSAVRDRRIVCVVEEPTNIATIEKTRSYNGVYHVLHGTLSPIGGVGPEQLRIANLLTRLAPVSSNGSHPHTETKSENTPSESATSHEDSSQSISAGTHAEDFDAIREIILATSPTTEGEATAAYIADEIRRIAPALRVTRIATGVPAGSDIEYADEVTMTRALEGRREF